MAQRTTTRDVERHIREMNAAMGRPVDAWGDDSANIGNYHLYGANGCYSLHLTMNDGGGVHSIMTGTLREVDMFVRGMWHAAVNMKEVA